jgi:hypothetical protein
VGDNPMNAKTLAAAIRGLKSRRLWAPADLTARAESLIQCDSESVEARRSAQQINACAQDWRDKAEKQAAQKLLLITPLERRAKRYGFLASLVSFRDRVTKLVVAADRPTPSIQQHTESAAVDSEENRRSIVDNFLKECSKIAGSKIMRKHIWMALGHKTARQFEYWQCVSHKATQADQTNFNRILSMNPSDFVALVLRIGPDRNDC